MTIARPKGTHHQDSGAKKRGYRAVPLFRPIIIIIIIIIIILSSMVQGVIMHCLGSAVLLLLILCVVLQQGAAACSGGRCELGDRCSSEADCGSELYCYNCWIEFAGRRCVRTTAADPFKIVDTSLPFNRYAFLTTHNSFSIRGEPSRTGVPRITLYNQDDSVTDQLNNGVRALMLDVYDFRDDIWLCHSKGGKCFDFTAFEPAIGTMMEVEAFLSANPSEIVTLILEDYVGSDRGLSKLVDAAGLTKYWFPVSGMPRDGGDWPRVGDMIRRNHRLLVFTSDESKQRAEGIAYQWNFMVESQYGDGGMSSRACRRRAESLALDNRTRSLVLVNYFHTVPLRVTACVEHSLGLADVLGACHAAAGNRWANFLAVDYYKVGTVLSAFACFYVGAAIGHWSLERLKEMRAISEKRRRRRVRGHGHAQRDAHLRPRRRASVHETDSQGRVLRPAWQGRADAGSRCAKDMRSRSVLVGCACHVCCTHVACPAMRYA